jgi:ADP-heptose:LPS heptosyltransferase
MHARQFGIAELHVHSVVRADAAEHASLTYARMLGVEPPLPPPSLRLAQHRPEGAWRSDPSCRLLIHPGAGAPAKRWHAARFAALASEWRSRGGEVTLLLGPAEEPEVTSWRATGHQVVHGLSVRDAAALVASAPRYVGNDAGMSHLAGALARSGVVLFGPTRPVRWRPLGGDLTPVDFSGGDDERVADAIREHLGAPGSMPRRSADTSLDTPTPEH